MSYPGEGYKMSNYGLKRYSPEQLKEQWRENIDRQGKITKYHTSSRRASEAQPSVDTTKQLTYFNNNKRHPQISTYDRTFHVPEGYCSKLKRDDLQHTQGLNVHSEENIKSVPILTSSVYGHRPPLEIPGREHVRVGLVQRDFYRPCGTNMNSAV